MKPTIPNLIKILQLLADPETVIVHPELGICYNLDDYFPKWEVISNTKVDLGSYALVEYLSRDWKHHSGENGYPVLGHDDFYDNKSRLWKGKQGKLRRNLCLHLIERISTFRNIKSLEKFLRVEMDKE